MIRVSLIYTTLQCLHLSHSYCGMNILVTTFILQNGVTPLMLAAREGHLSVVELLVSVGAQVNSQSNVSH